MLHHDPSYDSDIGVNFFFALSLVIFPEIVIRSKNGINFNFQSFEWVTAVCKENRCVWKHLHHLGVTKSCNWLHSIQAHKSTFLERDEILSICRSSLWENCKLGLCLSSDKVVLAVHDLLKNRFPGIL